MKYLLDTCVISDIVKGDQNTLKHLKNTAPSDITVSSITVMEIHYGLMLNPDRAKKIKPILSDLLASISILDFSSEDAFHAGKVRATLKNAGQPIGSYDVLLAGVALRYQLTLITSNTAEFARVAGLTLKNWRNAG
jgi:tRNA(fMet)-specific endonuclease VapC